MVLNPEIYKNSSVLHFICLMSPHTLTSPDPITFNHLCGKLKFHVIQHFLFILFRNFEFILKPLKFISV